MARSYVFISYSRQDREFVDRLSSALNRNGIHTWVDTQNIQAGFNWQSEIENAVFKSDALIYVSSEHSAESKWLEAELNAFLSRNGQVIPLVLDDAGASHMPQSLRHIQWVDFRGEFDNAMHLLLSGIQMLRGSQPVPEKPKLSKGYVFISYASVDKPYVEELKQFLAERGYSYWDFHSSKRNYQIDYTLELEERIRDAEATLSVITPSWKESNRTFQELHFSKEIGTPVFLLRFKDPGPTLALAGLTYIEFSGSHDHGFERLAAEMHDAGL